MRQPYANSGRDASRSVVQQGKDKNDGNGDDYIGCAIRKDSVYWCVSFIAKMTLCLSMMAFGFARFIIGGLTLNDSYCEVPGQLKLQSWLIVDGAFGLLLGIFFTIIMSITPGIGEKGLNRCLFCVKVAYFIVILITVGWSSFGTYLLATPCTYASACTLSNVTNATNTTLSYISSSPMQTSAPALLSSAFGNELVTSNTTTIYSTMGSRMYTTFVISNIVDWIVISLYIMFAIFNLDDVFKKYSDE